MKKISFTTKIATLLFSISAYATTPTSPIQRIDLINTLCNSASSSPGATQTPIVAQFYNDGPSPCFTITIPFHNSITIFAGQNQSCSIAITSVQITPLEGPTDVGIVYATPPILNLTPGKFNTKITVTDNVHPTFDPANGALLTQGTVLLTEATQILNR